jgi:hypothetical protein
MGRKREGGELKKNHTQAPQKEAARRNLFISSHIYKYSICRILIYRNRILFIRRDEIHHILVPMIYLVDDVKIQQLWRKLAEYRIQDVHPDGCL